MRIALNLIGYKPGIGGVETYVTNLFAALQKVDRVNDYLVLCDEIAANALMPVCDNFRIKIFDYNQASIRWILRGISQRTFGIDILATVLKNLPVDVMHHPLTVLNPPGLPYPSVLTFHDMQQEFFPEFFPQAELSRRKQSYLSSVMEASAVVTLSTHGKSCLVERYGVDPSKVHVVPSGCGQEFQLRDLQSLTELIRKYDIRRPFMIYPASTWPHKNHLRLLEAVRLLLDRRIFDGELLLTGLPMNAHTDVMEGIGRMGLSNTVRWLGYIPHEDLPCLYNLARLMVFPSLFEGFGLPVVEAMASGCPVICSSSSSLPEVAGESAIYCDPTSVDDIADKIEHLWEDDSKQSVLRKLGLMNAAHFRWEDSALKTLDVYRSFSGEKR